MGHDGHSKDIGNGNSLTPFLTMREALLEVRDDVKSLRVEVAELRTDRETIHEIEKDKIDQEMRIRSLERWKYAIPINTVLIVMSFVAAFLGERLVL